MFLSMIVFIGKKCLPAAAAAAAALYAMSVHDSGR
jgi:hypothetical protein